MTDQIFRPIGGIESVELRPSLETEAVAAPSVTIDLLEDRSTYTESITWSGNLPKVKHTLTIVTNAQSEAIPASLLSEGLREGFLADITLKCGASFTVGHSALAGLDRPLRLTETLFESGTKPQDRPLKIWRFESLDSEYYVG